MNMEHVGVMVAIGSAGLMLVMLTFAPRPTPKPQEDPLERAKRLATAAGLAPGKTFFVPNSGKTAHDTATLRMRTHLLRGAGYLVRQRDSKIETAQVKTTDHFGQTQFVFK